MKHVLCHTGRSPDSGLQTIACRLPTFFNWQLTIVSGSGMLALNLAHYSAWGRAGFAPASLLSLMAPVHTYCVVRIYFYDFAIVNYFFTIFLADRKNPCVFSVQSQMKTLHACLPCLRCLERYARPPFHKVLINFNDVNCLRFTL